MGRKAVDASQLFLDGLRIPVEDRVGEEGKGFDYMLHGLNLRESWIPRLEPVSPQLILCFIVEKVLGLPKSY